MVVGETYEVTQSVNLYGSEALMRVVCMEISIIIILVVHIDYTQGYVLVKLEAIFEITVVCW